MPIIYNGSTSRLEDIAINGNPAFPNTGRLNLMGLTKIGTGKYTFDGPYKNSIITGDANDEYGVGNTNALSDNLTPYNGKGTGDGISNGELTARYNYNGGNLEDRTGTLSANNAGRNPLITLNASIWGYGPSQISGSQYIAPDTSLNVGQVII